MAATGRLQQELARKAAKEQFSAEDLLEKLRAKCLARGATGIHGLAIQFKIFDDNKNKKLELEEFKKGMMDYAMGFSKEEITSLFTRFDKDGSGCIDFDEFLENLRPPMNAPRKQVVLEAFNKLDKTKDGKITIDDLKGVYNVKQHPKYLNGEWSEEQILRKFLDTFDTKGKEDGTITKDEFINYYSSVSASIDNDAYFILMMKTNWKL